MLATPVSAWEPVPSELDELWCPLVEFVSGCAESGVVLLLGGGSKPSQPAFEGERHFLLHFGRVEAVFGYSEVVYNTYIRPADPNGPRVSSHIERATDSELLASVACLRSGSLAHYRVSTGGMQCEIIAHVDFELSRFDTREQALKAASQLRHGQVSNFDVSANEGRAALAELLARTGAK